MHAHLLDVPCVLERQLRNLSPAVKVNDDQSVPLKEAERLAHRQFAEIKRLRDLAQAQTIARPEMAVEDLAPEGFVSVIGFREHHGMALIGGSMQKPHPGLRGKPTSFSTVQ